MTLLSGRFRAALDTFRGSYWLIPALMGLAAVALAVATGRVDRWLLPDVSRRWGRWISTAGPDAARAVLTTIAASMMTLASLTYNATSVSAVSRELMTSIEASATRAGGVPDDRAATTMPVEAAPVPSPTTGYVTLTDVPAMVQACEASGGGAQLVEVALCALSPGINDPFTAMACVDRLGVALPPRSAPA